jgi:hypothetical protein
MTAPRSFYEFLTTYVSPSPYGDPIADVGHDLRFDEKAPRGDADLYQHLIHYPSNSGVAFDEAVEEAWLTYLGTRG